MWQLIKYFFASRDVMLYIIMCHWYKLASLNWCCQLLPVSYTHLTLPTNREV